MSEFKLHQSIDELSGVGKAYSKKLAKLGIETIEDLLHHFPYRYEDRSQISKIEKINSSSSYSIKANINKINLRKAKSNPKMKLTEAVAQDESGEIKVMWFNQPYLKNALKNKKVYLSGEVSWWHGSPTMINPDYQVARKAKKSIHISRIIPIYPQTEGVSSKWLRSKIFEVLAKIRIKEILPEEILENNNLVSLKEALGQIHFPDNLKKIGEAKKRLSFDELLLMIIQADLADRKLAKKKAPKINFREDLSKKYINSLNFNLTDDQKIAAWQIIKDLGKNRPMNRLLNGDVGSGKTVVAIIAALNVVNSGYQVALMAPTEVLAVQHYRTIKSQFKDFDINVDLYTSSKKTIDLTKNSTKSQFIVGTQALIQDQVELDRPGLVIVDEQQRFGVKQRQKLEQISKDERWPHFLTMSATPIPRTLAIAIYGDLRTSFIKELPKDRKPVKTEIVRKNNKEKVYRFIKKELNNNHQAFVICPLIEDNNEAVEEKASLRKEYNKLKKGPFKDFKINYLHGQMSSEEKRKVMREFREKRFDILVSTSVVEIGLDIPGATVMLIEGAEQFGLSQLHQFRGRVGRNNHQAYCFLAPRKTTDKINKRLKVISSTNDGFKIAREDLKLRGPGEILGERQHGKIDLKLASFFDFRLIKTARKVADRLLKESPRLDKYKALKNRIKQLELKAHIE